MPSLRLMFLALLPCALLPAAALRAMAQEPFGNPLVSAEALHQQRGAPPDAILRLR
jgi:hypothetical protein